MQLALILLAVCLLANGQGEEIPLSKTFQHEGMARSYILYRPATVLAEAPLVFVLHGYTSSAEGIMRYTKFNEIADREGFLVVYPQGSTDHRGNTFWNVGYEFHKESDVDDLEFLTSLGTYLVKEYKLSVRNIFMTGMSNGGDMSYLQACVNPDFFNALAPIAGTMMVNAFDKCDRSQLPALLAVAGNNDEITRFEGDMENKDQWGAYQSIPFIVDYWTNRLDHDNKRSEVLPNIVEGDSSIVKRTLFENTSTKLRFDFYEVVNGGHDWPGAYGNMDINTSELVWSFFKSNLK